MCTQEQSDRLLVMYPSTLIILSEENDGLFYKVTDHLHLNTSVCAYGISKACFDTLLWLQGKLPLNMITVTTPCQDVKPNTFKIEGK